MKIRNLLFDLDNTLYPETSLIASNMTKRIISYVADFLSISYEDAALARKDGLTRCGTTLEWLITENSLKDTSHYFQSIHPAKEIEEVPFDPKLRPFLEELSTQYHMSVLTNAPTIHADNILNHLKIYDLFDGVYDLNSNNFFGKPAANAYKMAIEEQGFAIEETVFFDDHIGYVQGFADIGGKSVLIDLLGHYANKDISNIPLFACVTSIYQIPEIL